MGIKCFRDLEIWKLGKEIVIDVYKVTKDFPEEERFGLISQMRRASVSIPSNIAEGFNRFQNKEFRRFLYISLGSCAELETQIEISHDLEYMNEQEKVIILDKIKFESRMISNLIKKTY